MSRLEQLRKQVHDEKDLSDNDKEFLRSVPEGQEILELYERLKERREALYKISEAYVNAQFAETERSVSRDVLFDRLTTKLADNRGLTVMELNEADKLLQF